MPITGFTSITVPVSLKDSLMQASASMGFASVPSMLQSWLELRTGTVRVRDGAPIDGRGGLERARFLAPMGESVGNVGEAGWCGRRDSNPGLLRGRQLSYQARLRPRAPLKFRRLILISYPDASPSLVLEVDGPKPLSVHPHPVDDTPGNQEDCPHDQGRRVEEGYE